MTDGNPNPNRAYRPFIFVVCAAGAILGLVLSLSGNADAIRRDPVPFLLLAGVLIVSELLIVEVPYRLGGQIEEQTLSEIFAFTLMLGWGIAPSVLAVSLSALIGQSILRRPTVKVVFNSAQLGLSLFAAGGVYYLLGGYEGPFSIEKLVPFIVAAYVYHIVNHSLVDTVIALHENVPLSSSFKFIIVPRWFDFLMIGMAPIILVVIQTDPALAPLLALPVLAIYSAMRSAMKAEAEAERSRRLVELEKEVVRRLEDNERLREEFVAAIGKEIWTPLIQDSMEVMSQEHPSTVDHKSSVNKQSTGPIEEVGHRTSGRPRPWDVAQFHDTNPRLFRTAMVILGIIIVAIVPIIASGGGGNPDRNIVVSVALVSFSTLLLLTLSLLARFTTRTRRTQPVKEGQHVQVLRDTYSLERHILAGLRAGGRSSVSPYSMRLTTSGEESSKIIDPTTDRETD
jgi:hypothetical protein